jgi:hypothetical protein
MCLRILEQLPLTEKSSYRLGRSIFFFSWSMVSLAEPQEGLHGERENVGGADNVCLGNIADKVFLHSGWF